MNWRFKILRGWVCPYVRDIHTHVAEWLRALFLNHRSSHSCVWCGFEPALATCETSQVLLVGVPGGFSWSSPVFAHLLIGPSHMS